MKTYVKYRKECAERVFLFSEQTEITLTPLETTMFGNVGTVLTAMQNWGVDQVSGNLAFRDGALDRKVTATAIRQKMRSICAMAKSIELFGVAGVTSALFRMPKQRSYAVLATAALAFSEAVEPHKTKFIERGLPTTFVEDLEALVTQLNADYEQRENGRFNQTGGTAGLEALADEALKLIQQLRPIMREHLKDNPGLLGAWNLASRVQSSRRPKSTAPADPDSQSGGSGGIHPLG